MTYTPEQNAAYLRKRYAEQMKEFHEALGGKCVRCGSTEEIEIDHIDRTTKSFNIGRLWAKKDLPKVYEELAKCQLLCRTHHIEKTTIEFTGEDRGMTHGTLYAWMKKGCSCDVCAKAKRKWHDARNAKRRTGARGPYKPRSNASGVAAR